QRLDRLRWQILAHHLQAGRRCRAGGLSGSCYENSTDGRRRGNGHVQRQIHCGPIQESERPKGREVTASRRLCGREKNPIDLYRASRQKGCPGPNEKRQIARWLSRGVLLCPDKLTELPPGLGRRFRWSSC